MLTELQHVSPMPCHSTMGSGPLLSGSAAEYASVCIACCFQAGNSHAARHVNCLRSSRARLLRGLPAGSALRPHALRRLERTDAPAERSGGGGRAVPRGHARTGPLPGGPGGRAAARGARLGLCGARGRLAWPLRRPRAKPDRSGPEGLSRASTALQALRAPQQALRAPRLLPLAFCAPSRALRARSRAVSSPEARSHPPTRMAANPALVEAAQALGLCPAPFLGEEVLACRDGIQLTLAGVRSASGKCAPRARAPSPALPGGHSQATLRAGGTPRGGSS